MNLDIRVPIGLMFLIIGFLLVFYGTITANDAQIYARSGGININLYWGIVLLIFGGIMFFMGRRASATVRQITESAEEAKTEERGKH